MRVVALCLAAIAAAIALDGQIARPPDSSEQKQVAPCSVSGRVVTAADSTPLKSAHVYMREENPGREPKMYGAATDGDGRFVLKNVAPGRYQLFATHNGY